MITNLIRWLLIRPTADDYRYPDHYDFEAYVHALTVVHQPIQWRWPIAVAVRAYRQVRR